MTDTARLFELQKIDSNWEKVRRRLLQLQKLMVEPDNLRAARGQLASTEEQLHNWHARQQDAELTARGLADRIAQAEQKLMSGTVRNPKELDQLQANVAALKRQRSGVDEEGVNALLQVETLTSQKQQNQDALGQQEQQWNKRRAELTEEENKLKRYALQLKAQRSQLVTGLPGPDVEMYEDLRKRKAGVAVATVENGNCSACSVRVPVGVANALRSRAGVTHCTSCGRILVSPA